MGFGVKPAAWLLLLGLTGAVAGCGTYRWNKAGASDAEFQDDAKACDLARGPEAGSFEACMTGRGWRLD
jgi:hypothetical protein